MAEFQLQQNAPMGKIGVVDSLKSRKEKDKEKLERMRKLEDPKSTYSWRKGMTAVTTSKQLQATQRPQTAQIGGLYSTGYPAALNEPVKKPTKAYVSPYS